MSKFFTYAFLVVIIAAVGFYLKINYFSAVKGEEAPDFEAVLIDGTPFKMSELKGKYVILDFWGSWCPPCIKENPKLVELYQAHKDDVYIVTIALEKNLTTWKKAADKAGFSWKYQIVEENRFVMLSEIARKYGVTEIPAKFLISPEGKLVGKLSFEEIQHILSKL